MEQNTHEVGVFGQRVVTFADVDAVHEKPKGSAKDRFYKNKKRFKLGEDYFVIKPQDLIEAQKYMSHTSETEKNEIRSFGLENVDHVADLIINMMGRDVYEQALREYKITYHCGAPRKRYKVIEMMPEYHFRYQCALAHKINAIRMEAFE